MQVKVRGQGFGKVRRNLRWYKKNMREIERRALFELASELFEAVLSITPIGPESDHSSGGRYEDLPHLIEEMFLREEQTSRGVNFVLGNEHPNAVMVHFEDYNYITNNPNGQYLYIDRPVAAMEPTALRNLRDKMWRMVKAKRLIGEEPRELWGQW